MRQLSGRRNLLFLSHVICWLGAASASHAGCVQPGTHLSRFEVESLVEDPRRLLARHPGGGPKLAFEVQSLAIASPETLGVVLKSVRAATLDQRQAIGLGLRRAAAYCLPKDGSVTKRIDEGVRKLNDRDLTIAYAGASDPRPLQGMGATATDGILGTGTSSKDQPSLSAMQPPPPPSSRPSLMPRQLDGSDLNLPDPGHVSDPTAFR